MSDFDSVGEWYHGQWALLVLGLLLFLVVASFHLIVTLLGGVLGGLIKGTIIQIQSALKGS